MIGLLFYYSHMDKSSYRRLEKNLIYNYQYAAIHMSVNQLKCSQMTKPVCSVYFWLIQFI